MNFRLNRKPIIDDKRAMRFCNKSLLNYKSKEHSEDVPSVKPEKLSTSIPQRKNTKKKLNSSRAEYTLPVLLNGRYDFRISQHYLR